MFVQQCQDSCLVTMDTSESETRFFRTNRRHLEVRRDTEGQFLTGTMILGFLSIFKKSQAPSPFEALNSTRLSKFEKDLRPHVQMKGRSRAFSMVSTGDSDITSSSEMNDETALKPLQGNPAFSLVRVSRGPFHLWQKT